MSSLPCLVLLYLEEFNVEDEGGVGRDVACALLAVGVFGGDGYLHLVAGAHAGKGHLEPHNKVAHDEAGGDFGRGAGALAGAACGVEHSAVDEAAGIVDVDDVGRSGKAAVGGARHDGAALDPAEGGARGQKGDALVLGEESDVFAVRVAIEVLVLFHGYVWAFCKKKCGGLA